MQALRISRHTRYYTTRDADFVIVLLACVFLHWRFVPFVCKRPRIVSQLLMSSFKHEPLWVATASLSKNHQCLINSRTN